MLAKRGAYNIPPADKTNIIPTRKHVTSQQIRDDEPILYYCWASVEDGVPTVIQHRVIFSYLLVIWPAPEHDTGLRCGTCSVVRGGFLLDQRRNIDSIIRVKGRFLIYYKSMKPGFWVIHTSQWQVHSQISLFYSTIVNMTGGSGGCRLARHSSEFVHRSRWS